MPATGAAEPRQHAVIEDRRPDYMHQGREEMVVVSGLTNLLPSVTEQLIQNQLLLCNNPTLIASLGPKRHHALAHASLTTAHLIRPHFRIGFPLSL